MNEHPIDRWHATKKELVLVPCEMCSRPIGEHDDDEYPYEWYCISELQEDINRLRSHGATLESLLQQARDRLHSISEYSEQGDADRQLAREIDKVLNNRH